MSGELGVGRARALSTPVVKTEVETANKTAKLESGTTIGLATKSSDPPTLTKTDGPAKSASDPNTPPAKSVSETSLQVKAEGSGKVDAPKQVANEELDERTAAGKALHQEATAALDFLLGDLGNFVQKPPHIPKPEIHSGRFEPTNDTHAAAAKDMLKQLVREHTTLGIKDGVAKAAERVLAALDNAVSDLKGLGMSFSDDTPKPITLSTPTQVTPTQIWADKGKEEVEDDHRDLSSGLGKLKEELLSNPVSSDPSSGVKAKKDDDSDPSIERRPRHERRDAILIRKDDVPAFLEKLGGQKLQQSQGNLVDCMEELRTELQNKPEGNQRPEVGPGIGRDPIVLPELHLDDD